MLLEIIDSEKVHTIQSERVTEIGEIHSGFDVEWRGNSFSRFDKPIMIYFEYVTLTQTGRDWHYIQYYCNYSPTEMNNGIPFEPSRYMNQAAFDIAEKYRKSEQYKKDMEIVESARYQMELQCPQVKQPIIKINLLK